jgi:hypothetical protein
MSVVYVQLAEGVLPVLGQFVLPAVVGAVVVLVVVRDLRRRVAGRSRDEDEMLPLLIVPRAGPPREDLRPALPPEPPMPDPLMPMPLPVSPRASLPDPSPIFPGPPLRPRELEADPGSETISIDLIGMGTVQLLPGRLEVVRGMEVGREFRFVRAMGQLITEVTLGRATGPMHRHVQLPVPTVSRMHARLRHEAGRWTITNLSVTNPVRVNGRELFGREDSQPLADGDRILIGEVELRFWEEG